MASIPVRPATRTLRLPARDDRGPLVFRIRRSSPSPENGALPIVLIHGVGMSHRSLSRLQAALASQRAVHSVDLPGFGGLARPTGDLDVKGMADALAETLESLALGPVVMIGHSMGAQWVVELALARPDLLARLVLIGPVVDAQRRSHAAQFRALALDTLSESPVANAISFFDYARCGVRWYLAQVKHMLAYPIEQRLALLAMPLLIIRGANDPIAGLAWCRGLCALSAQAQLVLVPGAHHHVQHSAPAATASAILALTSSGGAPAPIA